MAVAIPTFCQASTSTPPQGQRDAARLCSSSGGPAGAFPTAIPGGRMTLGNNMFGVSVWHRLGHHVPQSRRCCRSRSCDGLREGSQDDPDAPSWRIWLILATFSQTIA